jgi:hypothetical protein
LVPRLQQHLAQTEIPGRKGHVGKGHPVADQPLGVGGFGGQHAVDDAQHALDLAAVTLDGRRDLLRVQVLELAGLAKVGALAAYLEV